MPYLVAPTTTLARQALPAPQIVFGQPSVGSLGFLSGDPTFDVSTEGFRRIGTQLGAAGVEAGLLVRALLGPGFGKNAASAFTGGATGREPGVLGFPPLGGFGVGFLDSLSDFIGVLGEAVPIAQQVGLLPPPPPLIGTVPGPIAGPGQFGVPDVEFVGVGGALARQLPGVVGGVLGGELVERFFGGGSAMEPTVGGIRVAGRCEGLFHTTPTGKRLPNRISLVTDPSGAAAFMVNAGRPLTWSKISLKKSRPRHHHHRPY